jgi:hypothetical protein
MFDKHQPRRKQLFESKLNSLQHGHLSLDEYQAGHVVISTCDRFDNSSSFLIPSSTAGIKEAEELICSLQDWLEKTRISLGLTTPKDKQENLEIPIEYT